MRSPPATFYTLLGVREDASAEEIRSAYRRRANQFHPDKNRDRSDAAAHMAKINRAYEVLSDADQRAAYDQDLQSQNLVQARPPVAPLAIGGWPWYVMTGTLCVILLAIGLVALKARAPTRSSPVPVTASPPVQLAEPVHAVAASPIRPWQEPPPKAAAPADDPVARLVREGVVHRKASSAP